MKIIKKLLIAVIFVSIIIFCKNTSYAGTQSLNSLDYDVELNSDGSMDVVETWNIHISDTNTLFKDFKLDSSKYSGITDVKVKNVSTGAELAQIYEEMYHVTNDCYYALPIEENKFEIAWGVGLDNSSANRKYQISYTIEDAITVYNDCSELYWQFIGTDNGIPADEVTGTIHLPNAVKDIEKLRVWAHGPLNGEINKVSNDTVEFFVKHFASSTMLETRVVLEENLFPYSNKTVMKNKLQSIIEEETKWAEKANNERNSYLKKLIIFGIFYLIVLIFFGKKILKYRKDFKQASEEYYEVQIGEYFRDIPREKDATPAEAAFLYYSKNNLFDISNDESKVFSATLLQLCLKGYIAFEKGEKKDVKIVFLDAISNKNTLKSTEKEILDLIKTASSSEESVTIKELKQYAQTNYDEFEKKMETLQKGAKQSFIENEMYSEIAEKECLKYRTKMGGYVLGLFFFVFTFGIIYGIITLPLIAEWILSTVYLSKLANKIKVLSEKGEIERQQWRGLKKYMEDFSMLDQRDIPDLVLWEKYLVYATAFGISDKVIKQLKVVYPKIDDLNDDRFMYMHMISSSNYGDRFIEEFNSGIDKVYSSYRNAYSSAHSSGSGSGGGFSGGGGGRRWRWPEWAEDRRKT